MFKMHAAVSPEEKNAVAYVRPHLLDVERQPRTELHFRATVNHISAAGPLAKVEATTQWGDPVHIELSQERFRELELRKGDEVFLIPRDMKVFRDMARR